MWTLTRLRLLALAARRRRPLAGARAASPSGSRSTPSTTRGSCRSPAAAHLVGAASCGRARARTRLGAALPRGAARPPSRRRRALAALGAMAILGPLVFYALWPWIWHDTLRRLRDYARVPPEPRVLQHGVPRRELLDAADAERLRVGDDARRRCRRHARALRRAPRGLATRRAGLVRGGGEPRRPDGAADRPALAPRRPRQLRGLALARARRSSAAPSTG